MDSVIKRIKEEVVEHMSANSHTGHDLQHIERVHEIAKKIGEKEKCDMLVLEAATLMHDLERNNESKENNIDHSYESAKIAIEIMNKVNFPKNKMNNVVESIKNHRFRKNIKPKQIEAKILQDADRIDALGAIGIMRAVSVGTNYNNLYYDPNDPICRKKKIFEDDKYIIDHFYKKLLKISSTLNTKTAKEIAKKRENFMKLFLEQLELEIKDKL